MRKIIYMTNYIQSDFHKVNAPFLTLHGTSDRVTCLSGLECCTRRHLVRTSLRIIRDEGSFFDTWQARQCRQSCVR
ncbi:putative 2-acylglycerol O-acyltransferase [Helianthus anomalus]